MKFEYLIFNLFIFTVSTSPGFFLKWMKLPELRKAFLSIACISTPYLIWDFLVTNSWWSFNEQYITGIRFFSLPFEEILFFLTVPWSCLIIWVNLEPLIQGRTTIKLEWPILLGSIALCLLALTQEWWYTFAIGILGVGWSILSAVSHFWIGQYRSMVFLLITVTLTCIFNGYLTARPVVIYNAEVLSTYSIGTIPIEDIGYGIVLVSSIAMVYEYLVRSKIPEQGPEKFIFSAMKKTIDRWTGSFRYYTRR